MAIDLEQARRQHRAYESALASLGCEVRRLPDADELPDAVFVQDAALVFDEVAVIVAGAASRRPETASVAGALQPLRSLRWIDAPGTLDGGDVVCLGRRLSSARRPAQCGRSAAMADIFGLRLYGVCCDAAAAAPSNRRHAGGRRRLLVNREWVDPSVFGDVEIIDVDSDEPFAANALRVGDALIFPNCFPKTQTRLEARGLRVIALDTSELAKAEAGVTCCCLLVA